MTAHPLAATRAAVRGGTTDDGRCKRTADGVMRLAGSFRRTAVQRPCDLTWRRPHTSWRPSRAPIDGHGHCTRWPGERHTHATHTERAPSRLGLGMCCRRRGRSCVLAATPRNPRNPLPTHRRNPCRDGATGANRNPIQDGTTNAAEGRSSSAQSHHLETAHSGSHMCTRRRRRTRRPGSHLESSILNFCVLEI